MMMMMPLVFTFMFLWMPSGLTVYWFFSNLLAIGQQYITNQAGGPAERAAAARRAEAEDEAGVTGSRAASGFGIQGPGSGAALRPES